MILDGLSKAESRDTENVFLTRAEGIATGGLSMRTRPCSPPPRADKHVLIFAAADLAAVAVSSLMYSPIALGGPIFARLCLKSDLGWLGHRCALPQPPLHESWVFRQNLAGISYKFGPLGLWILVPLPV